MRHTRRHAPHHTAASSHHAIKDHLTTPLLSPYFNTRYGTGVALLYLWYR